MSALKIKDTLLPVQKGKHRLTLRELEKRPEGEKSGYKRDKRNRRMTRVFVCACAGIADRERHSL